MDTLTARRVLARAAVLLGGVDRLAGRVNLTQRELGEFLRGRAPVPDSLFLAALDIVLEDLPEPRGASRSGASANQPAAKG
jgi:hypothetical protein